VKHIESNEKNITVSASVVCSEQKLDIPHLGDFVIGNNPVDIWIVIDQ